MGSDVENKPRHFTLMIMPETSGAEVKRMRVSRRLIQGVVVSVALVGVCAVAAVAQSAVLWGQADRNADLRAENERLRAELGTIDDRVKALDRTVARLSSFDEKVRALTMVQDPARNLAIGPVGGPEEETQGAAELSADALRRDLFAGRVDRALALVGTRTERAREDAQAAVEASQDLSVFLEGQQAQLSSTPSRRPTAGYVTSTFGMRIDPFTGLAQRHAGIDFSANIGTPISATADGTVVYAARKGAYGKTIEIDHGQGLVTKFAHLSRIDVRLGDEVTRGQVVGAMGNTGRSTGPHLHYEVRLNGIALDPQRFLLE